MRCKARSQVTDISPGLGVELCLVLPPRGRLLCRPWPLYPGEWVRPSAHCPSPPAGTCLSLHLCSAGKASVEQGCPSAAANTVPALLKHCGSGWLQAPGDLERGQV